jgi:hypothetical protein
MDLARSFRRTLTLRIALAMGVAVPPLALSAGSGCGSVVGGSGGNGGNGGNGAGGGQLIQACIQWPPPSASQDAGAGGAPPCPSQGDALTYIDSQDCGVTKVESGPTDNGEQCCYQVLQMSCVLAGRPFLVERAARTAAPVRSGERGWIDGEAPSPRVEGLPAETRARLAEAWARDGLFEHASVASFGRFALELLAAGAPSELVEAAHRAALDEVRHARLCLALAAAYAGEPVAPAPFPFGGPVEVSADLADLAARAASEGCVGETLAAVQAAEQLARAEDPAVRAALAIIAEDEARHAELAWRTVAWAVRTGGERVREAVRDALTEAQRGALAALAAPPCDAAMSAHGRLGGEALRAGLARALEDVVRPCAEVFALPAA